MFETKVSNIFLFSTAFIGRADMPKQQNKNKKKVFLDKIKIN